MLALGASALLPRGIALASNAPEPEGPFVADPLTGVAMGGYDPVSYFAEVTPQAGRADYEWVWAGSPWYFASAANRDVFMRAPTTYAPQFGGRCLLSLSRGYLSDGDPRLYAVFQQRLYLFYSVGNREGFLLSPASALHSAELNWPKLRATLATRIG